jgi:phosphoglycerate dehydrogenase-like enzyme
MRPPFLAGVTPDFFVDAKGRFEREMEQVLGEAGIPWEPMPDSGKTATLEAADRYDAILALGQRFTAESVTGARRLAVIARWGVGYDMIDTEALTANGIALAITPNAVKRPVAEAIFTFLFALTTNLMVQDRLVRAGKWRGELPRLGRNLKGRVLGSLGCGNIAREMFSMARSLGFRRLIAYDPFVPPETAAALGVEMVSKEEVFRESDYLTVNTLLNAGTRGLVGEAELRMMKPDAYLINTARGPIVNQAALCRALREGWIAGAGLDVFESEPLPADDPIRDCPNVIFAPHGLAWTEEIARDNSLEACRNIVSVASGIAPVSVVNREVLAHPLFLNKLERFRNPL